jgi:hypothetical protein
MKEDEIGRAGSMCAIDVKCIRYLKLENLKGRDHLEDLGIDRRKY